MTLSDPPTHSVSEAKRFFFLPDEDELWIGLHDQAMQMNFEWTDRTPVIFTHWHPFEPNNFLNTQEDCVTMWGRVSASSVSSQMSDFSQI